MPETSRRIPADIARMAFDVIIVGAGINGAGLARDAALRGLRVLLLDKNDLASGTTSWSTRLIHGGLRYLEHGEVGLVRESLRERERLFHIAPHLVRPLPMLIPIYEQARRGPLTIRAGMLAYDALSFDKSLARHRMLSRAETLRRAPGLKAEGLRGSALYHDAQVEYAERLVVENVLSARERGALVLTYARVERLLTEGNCVRGVEFTDMLEGGTHTARAPVVFNVAGPWVDSLLARFDIAAQSPRLIGGTKGSHIVVAPFAGAPATALYVEAGADVRPFFIIPWNRLYLIGTTDRRYEGDLDCVTADDAEIDYLLSETNRVIPAARLTRASILYTYSGIRPLAYSDDHAEKGITRRHFIHDHAPRLEGLLSIAGGKLTTYRRLAEQAVNQLFKKLGRASPRCLTAQTPLPGARFPDAGDFQTFSDRFHQQSSLPASVNERLLRVYGARAELLLKLVSEHAELGEVLTHDSAAIGAEVLLAFQHELACTLADCLLRRTMLGLDAAVGYGADEAVARVARKYLHWSEERAAREVAAYRAYVARFHPRGVKD